MAQIGTVKVETAGGPVELPVYELGDSGSNRVEAFRVQTASGPGFVPLTDVSAADRPYLRVQTGNGVKAFDTSASGIPDAVVAQYLFEDDSDSSVAIDNVGSNNADITGATYSPDSQSGSFALSPDGEGDYLQSQSTVDLVSSGETNAIGLGAFVKPQSTNRFPYVVSYGPTTVADFFGIWVDVEGGSGLNARLQVDSSFVDVNTSVDYGSYQHVYANATDTEFNIIVDGTVADSATHSIDISNLGSGSLWTSIRPDRVGNDDFSLSGLVDNATYSNSELTESDVQALINQ